MRPAEADDDSGRTPVDRSDRVGRPEDLADADRSGTTNGLPPDSCTLCELPVPEEPVTDPDVDGTFCCRGCLTVQRTLGDMADGTVADGRSGQRLRSETPDPATVDGEEVFFAVDGMHCSTCEAFLETIAMETEGVLAAEASYATDAIRLAYDPEVADPDDLRETLTLAGYTARPRGQPAEGSPEADLVRFLIGGGLFGMMVMVWYALVLYPTYLGFEPIVSLGGFDGLYLFGNVWLLTSVVLFYGGFPILRGAYVSVRARRPNMDLLVSLAAGGAYVYSTLAMLLGRTHLYFDVTVAIVLVVSAGNYWESRIKRRTAGLLSDLTDLQVEDARRADSAERVPVEAVEPGDRLLVKPGERIPLDGEVVEGRAAVDESLVTGESLPVTRRPGDSVRGGTVVTDEPLVVEVGEDTASTLDRVVGLLWRVQSARSGVQRLADRLATVFVPLVLAIAAVATVVLLVLGASPGTALLTGLTVVIVSCPCALGLATPLAVARGLRSGAERGIVVASDDLFETAPSVDTVVFDKTGTLTSGEMTVLAVEVPATDPNAAGRDRTDGDRHSDDESVLRRAAAVERLSAHPIATAVVAAADEADLPARSAVADFESLERGVAGVVDGTRVIAGHPSEFENAGWVLPDSIAAAATDTREAGDVPVVVGWDGRARGVIVVGDDPRPDWKDVVDSLAAEHRVVVLTGDEGRAAERFHSHPAIDDVFAGVPPEAKAETVARLRTRETVAMVGDGSNDAPALAEADVGIALGSGTKLATDAADAVLLGDRLEAVPVVFDLAGAARRRIGENLAWAFCYNAVAVPLAVAGLINPLLAAGAMAASSTLVVLNSGRSLSIDD